MTLPDGVKITKTIRKYEYVYILPERRGRGGWDCKTTFRSPETISMHSTYCRKCYRGRKGGDMALSHGVQITSKF
jgi:hypothetical protein